MHWYSLSCYRDWKVVNSIKILHLRIDHFFWPGVCILHQFLNYDCCWFGALVDKYYCFGKELKIKQIQSFKVSIQDFKLKKYKPGSRKCTKLRLKLRLFTTSKSFNWKKMHISLFTKIFNMELLQRSLKTNENISQCLESKKEKSYSIFESILIFFSEIFSLFHIYDGRRRLIVLVLGQIIPCMDCLWIMQHS